MPAMRVVVKVGSSSITDASGAPSDAALRRIVDQIARLAGRGVQVVLVTSGAIASGRGVVASTRHDITELQALAAVGQGMLMARYARLFAESDRSVGQILFTGHDFGQRRAYLNARNALERLLEWGVVPIVNANDTTATEEISLGENDRLAALIATMLRADLLVILTDTPGVFSADPRLSATAELIDEVSEVDAELEAVAGETHGGVGTGGMATKIAAAKIASWSGVACVIAGATQPDVIGDAVAGRPVGTRIHARSPALTARKVWIAFALRAQGRIVVDDGAAAALARGGSLLSVGMIGIDGEFDGTSAVEIVTRDGALLAKGLVRLSDTELRRLATHEGDAEAREAVHRDDLVWLVSGATAPAVTE